MRGSEVVNEVAVIATLRAALNRDDELAALLIKQAKAVRGAEPGCLVYRVHRSTSDPRLFVFYEVYADEAAFEAHRASAHLAEYRKLRDSQRLAAGPADVQVLRSITE
jgi:quinol monooxygenase YgiN